MADRSDKATCSNACRVRVHREGLAKRLIDECPISITKGQMARANAFDELCPELIPRVLSGSLSIEDVEARWAVHHAFMKILHEQIEARQ